MTFREFKKRAFDIYQDRFVGGPLSPLEYGIERASFEEEKLKRLIALAEKAEFLTAKRKIPGWQRQLKRVGDAKARLEHMRKEMPWTQPSAQPPVEDPKPPAFVH